jgi:IS30 family transposase
MAGQHIDRNARAEMTGMTDTTRDAMILRLHGAHWSQRKIARHLGMSQPGVLQAIKRLTGKERIQIKYAACDECGLNFPRTQIEEGLCLKCR